jgi:hypothetical protein
VVIEIGSTAGWVGDVVRAHGAEPEVANPSHQGWRWRNVKKKTDRMDALKLAQLSATNRLPKVHLPEVGVRQWRGTTSGGGGGCHHRRPAPVQERQTGGIVLRLGSQAFPVA